MQAFAPEDAASVLDAAASLGNKAVDVREEVRLLLQVMQHGVAATVGELRPEQLLALSSAYVGYDSGGALMKAIRALRKETADQMLRGGFTAMQVRPQLGKPTQASQDSGTGEEAPSRCKPALVSLFGP